jgi:hypothetical protein
MFWWQAGPGCCGTGKNVDWVYGIWCIPKLNESEGLIISPVAILSLSTSFFSASFRAVRYHGQISYETFSSGKVIQINTF